MTTERSTEISALFDGELEAHEVRAAIKASLNDADRWRMYGLIGDGLRGDPVDAPDITASVMARIGEEPVVLAPRNLKPRQRHHPLLALAASVAGVAVVGWVALTGNSQSPAAEHTLAMAQKGKMEIASAVSPAPTFAQAPQVVLQGDMSEYLLAHHAQASAGRLGDSTRQIRTVAMRPDRP
jgi:sigma-E factor negative regulatory protein RseA